MADEMLEQRIREWNRNWIKEGSGDYFTALADFVRREIAASLPSAEELARERFDSDSVSHGDGFVLFEDQERPVQSIIIGNAEKWLATIRRIQEGK